MTNDIVKGSGAGGLEMTKARLEEVRTFVGIALAGGYAPKGMTPETGICAILYGHELGLNPLQALQQVSVINGRPSIFGDAPLALVLKSGLMKGSPVETFEGDGEDFAAICKVTRVGSEPAIKRFSVKMAKKANLWGKTGPWTQYPSRMLQVRARAMALRDQFADVLSGISIGEEARDIPVQGGRSDVMELPATQVISAPSSSPEPSIVNGDPPGFDLSAKADEGRPADAPEFSNEPPWGKDDEGDPTRDDRDDRKLQEQEREEAPAPQEEVGERADLQGEVHDLIISLAKAGLEVGKYRDLPLDQMDADALQKTTAELRGMLAG